MNLEPDLTCPKCGNAMDLITADVDGSVIRVCPNCRTLAWNETDGGVETRDAQLITGEAKRELLENSKFISVEEELARLRRPRKTRDPE